MNQLIFFFTQKKKSFFSPKNFFFFFGKKIHILITLMPSQQGHGTSGTRLVVNTNTEPGRELGSEGFAPPRRRRRWAAKDDGGGRRTTGRPTAAATPQPSLPLPRPPTSTPSPPSSAESCSSGAPLPNQVLCQVRLPRSLLLFLLIIDFFSRFISACGGLDSGKKRGNNGKEKMAGDERV